MTRANFARTKPRHTAAFRSIAVAVRDWATAIQVAPTPYPTVLTVGFSYHTSPADLHRYSQVLERALARTADRVEKDPAVRANVLEALAQKYFVPLSH
jgi:hemoglobin-like flavoprotein